MSSSPSSTPDTLGNLCNSQLAGRRMDHNIAEINDVRCFRRFERDIAADHIGEPVDAPGL
ncbi:hypothetical protein I553_0990 [Mycobacterium xenopi 4042]|uniref:Uncharacterized protein n=1 Tax=Mycobacterium xenopi 4042 TaxID=1299334 RepID=X7ZBP4_MYCXE|nr:hypothetical protein I553_0990 [Mycobacterium xenopi 4042]